MSSVKEYWFDTRPTHELSFTCPKCQFPCAAFFHPPEPYEIIDDGDFHEEAVECLRCRSIWTAEVSADEDNDYLGILREHHDATVNISELDLSDDGDDWNDHFEPELRAFDIFQAGLKEWWEHITEIGDPRSGAVSINRMLFTQLFSLLEAYLFSEIIGIAQRDAAVQRGILKALPGLGEQAVKLSTIAEKPTLVSDAVKGALIDLSFHNLGLVETLCREGLQQGMLPIDKDERDLMMKAVSKRHDCVHRNGQTKDGKAVDDVTLDWLMSLAKAFERMAQRVQARVHDIDGYRIAAVLREYHPTRTEEIAATDEPPAVPQRVANLKTASLR